MTVYAASDLSQFQCRNLHAKCNFAQTNRDR